MGAAMDALEKCELFGNMNSSPPHTQTHTHRYSHSKPFTRFASVLNISLGCTVRKMAGRELWPDQPVGCDI